jgi:hypothetical protein
MRRLSPVVMYFLLNRHNGLVKILRSVETR